MTLFGFTIPVAAIFIIAGVIIVLGLVRAGVRYFRRRSSTLRDLSELVSYARAAANGAQEDEKPRSVSGGDSLFVPQIMKDFPDFSLQSAKDSVRAYVKELFGEREGFRIHAVAVSDYKRAGTEKTVIFQCAFEYKEDGHKVQKRYQLHYAHKLIAGEAYASQTCPSCGAAIPAGAIQCAYCGSRLIMTAAAWEITDAYER